MQQFKIYLTLFFLLFSFGGAFAQTPLQTVRGKVIDATTQKGLSEANVSLIGTTYQTATDTTGAFRFEEVPPGRYVLVASFIGFETYTQPGLLVESGKEVVIEIKLEATPSPLEEVVITGNRSSLALSQPLSRRTITIEETLRYPATFFDPARLAGSFAGVAAANDQANGISVRGNSPNSMSWWLEGVQIVNPNHTSNAGTFNDRVTQNGGGVNILSAQLLGNTNFHTGVFPVSFGNAIGGVLDMRLREGNNENLEFTGQAGLIGLDFAVEGPFSKDSDASYLVNYRYSTIGLLSSLGVPLGDEEINFQDLSFHLSFPLKNGAKLRVFGLGGMSENIFEAERDTSAWEFEKDRKDINFDSRMGALGAVLTVPIRNGIWNTTLAGSALESSRTAVTLDNNFEPRVATTDNDQLFQSRLSLHTRLQQRLSSRFRLDAGIIATNETGEIQTFADDPFIDIDDRINSWLIQPYVDLTWFMTNKFRVEAGWHSLYSSLSEELSLGPRLALRYELNGHQNISLSVGRYSQQQAYQLLLSNDVVNLGFTNSTQVVAGYRTGLGKWGVLDMEGFYQRLTDVPISATPNSFSALNYVSGIPADILINEGEGENYGLEMTWSKALRDDYFFLVNGTLYESRYIGSDDVWRSTRYNGNFIVNLTGGREKQWKRSDGRLYSLGTHARVAYLGGFRDSPIDRSASADFNRTIYQDDLAFTLQQDNYFRIDFRIYYKRNKANFSSTLALDIQNLTNQANVAFSYFDTEKQDIVIQEQLGIIPVLSYKIEF
jgi:hypothetical protein